MKEFENRLEEQLRHGRPIQPAPEGLAQRVRSRLERTELFPGPHRTAFPWFRLAIAVSLLVLLGSVFWNRPAPEQNNAAATNVEIAKGTLTIPLLPAETLSAIPVRLDDPLQEELDLLIADARKAVDYLAATFVPLPQD